MLADARPFLGRTTRSWCGQSGKGLRTSRRATRFGRVYGSRKIYKDAVGSCDQTDRLAPGQAVKFFCGPHRHLIPCLLHKAA